MSRNPKYCSVVVNTPSVQELRKQQERQRKLREKREHERAQREERERHRIAREKERRQGDLSVLVNELQRASLQTFHRHLDREAFTKIKKEAAAVLAALSGGTARAVNAAGREFHRLQQRWSAIRAAAQARSKSLASQDARTAAEADYRSRRAELRRLRDAVPEEVRRQIASMDRAGLKAMNDADIMLRDGMLGEAVKELARAFSLEERFQEHLTARGTHGEMIRELVAELDALKESRDVISWCSAEIKELTTALGALATEVSHDPLENTAAIEQLRTRLDAIPELASARELRHEERRTIAQATVGALERLGFIVSERRPDRPDGDWVVEAKHEQGSVAMELPATGEARFTSTAISHQDVRGVQAGCTNVLHLLDQLREGLRERHVELGDTHWEQEDPDEPVSAPRSRPSAVRRDDEARAQRGGRSSSSKVR